MDQHVDIDPGLEESTAAIEAKIAKRDSIPVDCGVVVGAIVGATVGAVGGPPGAVLGAAVGAAFGAGAGATMKISDAQEQAREAKLDRELGVVAGDIGAPCLEHPPSSLDSFRPPVLKQVSPDVSDADLDEWAGSSPVIAAPQGPAPVPRIATTTRMQLDLTVEEIRLLRQHLARHLDHVEAEVVGTDRRDLRHALAQELEMLRFIERKLREPHIVNPG